MEEYYYPEGEVVVNNQTFQVRFRFVGQTKRVFIDFLNCSDPSNEIGGYNIALDGECTFSPEKLIIKVDPKADRLFNGQYEELIFTRVCAEDEESAT